MRIEPMQISFHPKIQRNILKWQGKIVDVSAYPCTKELLVLFCENPTDPVCKSTITKKLFGNVYRFSLGMRRAIDHTINKRLSRARSLLSKKFDKNSQDIEWFAYDRHLQKWWLYKPRFRWSPAGLKESDNNRQESAVPENLNFN